MLRLIIPKDFQFKKQILSELAEDLKLVNRFESYTLKLGKNF